MAIVPRIAAVSNPDTIPFVHGIGHEGNFRADLVLTTPAGCIEQFIEEKADIALIPSSSVPALQGAELLTGFCVAGRGATGYAVLYANTPFEEMRRVFLCGDDPAQAQLAATLAARRWKVTPEWIVCRAAEPDAAADGDAYLVVGADTASYEGCFACSCDLEDAWYDLTGLEFVRWVWVARKGMPYQTTDAFEAALTYGVEHIWEALCEHGSADEANYLRLTESVDYLFDEQKRKALHKFWDSGVKVTPRINPG